MTTEKKKKKKNSMTKEQLRQYLETTFSENKKLISRHDPALNEIVAAGTLANHDSLGTGISERIMIKNRTFYGRESAIDWLVDHAGE